MFLSCTDEVQYPEETKKGSGTVWLSGGLYFCGEQIRLDSGDTLIVVNKLKIIKFKSGEHVTFTYKEALDTDRNCQIGINCEIIDIHKTD